MQSDLDREQRIAIFGRRTVERAEGGRRIPSPACRRGSLSGRYRPRRRPGSRAGTSRSAGPPCRG
jgi:hypothetical protein